MPINGSNALIERLDSELGYGTEWPSQAGISTTLWTFGYELLCPAEPQRPPALRRLWQERWNGRATPVVLVYATPDDPDNVTVVGPWEDDKTPRQLPLEPVVALLRNLREFEWADAGERLRDGLADMEKSATPGILVNGLLTPHFVADRLRRPENAAFLRQATEPVSPAHLADGWRTVARQLGYDADIEGIGNGNYLLQSDSTPIAVVRPYADAAGLKSSDNGRLPEGILLTACRQRRVPWGILTAEGRYRLFQQNPKTGAATGQWLELDTAAMESDSAPYLGLLAPDSLREGGRMTQWTEDARDFGEELRRGLEERIRNVALPCIARGLGEWLEGRRVDLNSREKLDEIGQAALTLVFRFMFVLHLEARDNLPIREARYRRHSAATIADDSRAENGPFGQNSLTLWNDLETLTGIMRNGDPAAGVPAYNGNLFAADKFPGAALLEEADIADRHLAPALAAIAFESDQPDAAGLDYAGLLVGHLGAIYEALLSYRLNRATEDLIYDAKSDVYRPRQAGDQDESTVKRSELVWQTEQGGRKAGGVYYTRHEFVRHLLNHSLLPALDEHLAEVAALLPGDEETAANKLFDFSVIDPAMGSAHFLTAALDMMADRFEQFMSEHPVPAVAGMLQELRADAGEPGADAMDSELLRRLILKRCIYGVDLSPMAVEIANVTLWLSSFVPGLALSYLGDNLKCGDALIGVADPAVLSPVGGEMMQRLDTQPVRDAMEQAARLQREQATIPDRTPEEVRRSEELGSRREEATAGLRCAFDLWTAEPLGLDGARQTLETHAAVIVQPDAEAASELADAFNGALRIATQYRFFHWPLEFPTVFHRERPGFDVVVGNPPWNKVKFEMPNFLALHDPGIRGLRTPLERDERAERLFQQRPELRQEMEEAKRTAEEQRKFFRPENGYTLQGGGDTDLYKLFCERYASIARNRGFMGVVLPRVAFLNDGSRGFRRWFFKECRPNRIDSLLNSGRWAFDMEGRYTIALASAQVGVSADGLLTITGPARNEREFSDAIAGEAIQVDLADLASWTPPPASDYVNQPTWELPLLPSPTHVSILSKMRRGVRFDFLDFGGFPKNRKGGAAAPSLTLYTELHSAQQRPLFNHPPGDGRVPVLKGSSFDLYEPHGNELAGHGDLERILEFLQAKRSKSRSFKRVFPQDVLDDPDTLPVRFPRVVFRHVARATDSRTIVASLCPKLVPTTDAIHCIAFWDWPPLSQASVLSVMSSIPFDWLGRRYIEANVNYFIFNSLTFPPPDSTPWRRIGRLAARLSCGDDRFADFAAEAGVHCGPLTTTQRDDMRAEIDALVAHAYGITADELRFIFTDFTENAVTTAYRRLVMSKFEGAQ